MLIVNLKINYKGEIDILSKLLKEKTGIFIIFIGITMFYFIITDVFVILDPFLFPSLKIVIPAFFKYIDKLSIGFISSMKLLIPAYMMALVLGISIGVVIGLKRILRNNITPYINAFSAVPATLLTPYAIHIFPTFKAASIFIIFIGSLWPILGTTISAVMTIDKRYLENADSLEIKGIEKLFKVILPAASPTILAGCTISLKFSFMLLAVAEMFGATSGMGYFIQYYSDFAKFDNVMVGFIFMSVVLVVIMYLFDKLKSKILFWTINN